MTTGGPSGSAAFPDVVTFVYDELMVTGRPPSLHAIGRRFGVSEVDARAIVASLNVGKTVLPHPDTGEIWMAGPFAAAPTPFRIEGPSATWYANCAWDMLGVAAMVATPVTMRTSCADCGAPIVVAAEPPSLGDADAVAHFLLPARAWYRDIGFT